MSYLLFIDESGSDQKQMPYEIHGGIVVPIAKAWNLIRTIKAAEARLFNSGMSRYRQELKGERLLQKRIFRHAEGRNRKDPEAPPPEYESDEDRSQCAYNFLAKGAAKQPPNAREFRAYGFACLELVDEIFQACENHEVKIRAAAVDRGAPRPERKQWEEMLRKDLVFLFERLFYFMETKPPGEMAICVFDQKDDLDGPRCIEGQRLNECIARYFSRSHTGRLRSTRVLPEPVYARSDLTTLLGVADLAIYTINHVFRPTPDWKQPIRDELRPYIDWISRLRWTGQRENQTWLHSVFYLADLRGRNQ